MKYKIEYTDTFSGEANYSWVRRYTLDVPENLSDLALVRRAKAIAGLSGVKGRMDNLGDEWHFRPHGMCTVLFITPHYA